MDDLDAQIGKNLARMRGEMSQADLAREMRDRGFKWSQATVWSVEKGERPLRLAEAKHLSSVLGESERVSPNAFFASDVETQLWDAVGPVVKANNEMEKAINAFLDAQDHLAIRADLISEKSPPGEGSTPLWFAVNNWLTEHTPSRTARQLEKEHAVEWHGDLRNEMADFGVTTIKQLVAARDKAAQEAGYDDYETEWNSNMKMGGNYSGLKTPIGKQEVDGDS